MTETARPIGRVHVVGAGPVGLFLAALLQSIDGQPVRLYERRAEYTRTRMVSLADVPRRRLDRELQGGHDRRAGRRGDLRAGRARDAAGLPAHRSPPTCARCSTSGRAGSSRSTRSSSTLSELIDARATGTVERVAGERHRRRGARDAGAGRHPRRLHRHPVAAARPPAPGRRPSTCAAGTRMRFRLEYALVVTFLYGQHYACNEYCKYYKNVENPDYKFIPAVHRTFYDGSISHVTGIISDQPRRSSRRCRRRSTARGCASSFPSVAAVDGPVHRQGQGGDPRRARRRPRDHADPARRLPRPERDEPALARVGRRPPAGRRRRSSCSGTRRSARRTSSRSRWASSARSSWPATSPTATCRSTRCSTATRRSCTSSGCGSTCAPR